MHVKLTLFRDDGSSQDVVVTAEPTASVRDIAARVAAADPRRSYDPERRYTLQTASPVAPQWRLLPPDAVIGDEWLASGLSVALVDEADAADLLPHLHAGATATLTVLSGPQAGFSAVLGRGSHTIGRDPSSDVVLADPYLSKRHVRVDVGQSVEVVDLGSANGVEIDGELVARARVTGGLVILVGGTELLIEVEAHEAARRADQVGPVNFNRSPRVEERYNGRTFSVPEVPREAEDQPFPLLAMIAPVLLGGAMFALTGRPLTLLFIAMTPVMLVGAWITTRRRDKKKLGKQISRFDEGLAELAERLEGEKKIEQRLRVAEIPSSAEVLSAATQLSPLLWTRRPEHWNFLSLRLGTASMPSRNTIDDDQRGDLLFEFQERLDAVAEEHRLVDDVPIVVEFGESGAIGIAGEKEAAADVVASVLVQLTGLHSPAELIVTAALTPEWAATLDWLKWLPHATSPHSPFSGNHLAATEPAVAALLNDLEDLIAAREREVKRAREEARGAISAEGSALEAGAKVGQGAGGPSRAPRPLPAVVVVISDQASRDRGRIVDLSERGADVGVYPVWVARDATLLPAVCRTFVAVAPDPAQPPVVGLVRLGEALTAPVLDRVSRAEAEGFARSLSRVVDANVPVDDVSDLPQSVALVGLIDPELLSESDAVLERWRANDSITDRTPGQRVATRRRAGRLRATIGQTALGLMHLDLRTQGPHALVGGTTGSGKSEFLQAWVLGMAAEYGPDRVTFLFVDYKGGSAFAECVKLPHCVGLVTDLTPHLVRRALTSLRAELHHREALLHRKGAKDLLELEKRGDPDAPPALVLIIDEFAALVGEVPEFVDGVVDIAQRGRSLGIHLIMATQRPAGVIRDNLRANTNLRIALRMADESDSHDVIGEKDAAHFDPSIPGRAIAKTAPGRLERFQSGYAGGWSSTVAEPARVEVADMPFGIAAPWTAPSDDEAPVERDLGPTDQERLVGIVTEAARRARVPAPRRPWLDELPTAIDLLQLRSRTDDRLPLGVGDIPERQAQEVVAFQPDVDGHMAVFGTGGAGKSVALRSIAAAAALADASEVFVYGLDFGAGALRALDELPGVGAIVTGEDDERIMRLFRMLRGEIDRRARLYADARATSISEFRLTPGNEREPRILLLIDNFGAFRENWEIPVGRNEWYRVFQDVVALGRPLGIHVVLTSDRFASLSSAIASGIQRRVVLRMADDTAYAALDVPTDVLTEDSPAGRAMVQGRETQLGILGGSSAAADQTAALSALAARLREIGATAAPGIPALPAVVRLDSLPATRDHGIVIGLAEETLEPAAIIPTGAFVVAGPPGSGRSNALAVIAERAFALPGHAVYFFGPRRSPLAGDPRFAATAGSAEEAAALAKMLLSIVADPQSQSRCVVLIESIGDYLQTPADTPLVDMVRQFKREEHFVVAEAESSSWVSSWPLFGEFKNARRGLLLQPDQADGDVILKTSLPRVKRGDFPEGRGVLVGGGKAGRVQVALATTR
ncbi:FtsK/SpoIIIE domain-containing protein [Microbacterium sp. RU33B]|uniref:FtsK/SpoIIIE domain-containing protein n=1 Tax=Microbacterium sp. RU33B TaxID=1907390 RepID=UPI00095FA7CE|nr:FtsK/SpoIIIE domain-containing protein [Microbacterium sp. RU33B]SIT87484.1 DNA segregation ATPase FtsK/SpoIIIE, S-DNA-T family [Microbacterium sp. RU33B]